MLSVAIMINGNPIMARSAVNTGAKEGLGLESDRTIYSVDDGTTLLHHADDGAVALAIKLLGTIKEQGK